MRLDDYARVTYIPSVLTQTKIQASRSMFVERRYEDRRGHELACLVEMLYYKLKVASSIPGEQPYYPGVESASNRNEYRESS
jgi:hypothetical protein